MSFYRLRIFQCEVTGKGNLTFFDALDSEKQEAKMLQSRFPEQLAIPVLKSVQWRASSSPPVFSPVSRFFVFPELVGRLDHLVEAVYDRFKDRYFEGERKLHFGPSIPPQRPGLTLRPQASSLTSIPVPKMMTTGTTPHRKAATGLASQP